MLPNLPKFLKVRGVWAVGVLNKRARGEGGFADHKSDAVQGLQALRGHLRAGDGAAAGQGSVDRGSPCHLGTATSDRVAPGPRRSVDS